MSEINLQPKKTPMPTQDPLIRKSNFKEVELGYTKEQAVSEAKRCLGCKTRPCVSGCPVGIAIPDFIKAVANEDFEKAYAILKESSALPAVCGRVCPQETQCEGNCMRAKKEGCEAVSIGRLERFVADYMSERAEKPCLPKEKKPFSVAVIGSGPSSLSCAGDLAKLGYDVTVFEALHVAGGVLMYGIPEFRLPKKIVEREVDSLRALGVKFLTNTVVGKTLTLEELKSEYGFSAVYIGTGAGLPKFMGIDGENLKGVFSANEYLTRANLLRAYEEHSQTPIYKAKVAVVVGGGNVAMDAARTALRLGAEVHIVYRRGEEELPARREEIRHAKEEGIIFDLLTNPVRILRSKEENPKAEKYGWVDGVECVRMELGEADESGRRSPVEVKGSDFVIPADCVIMALGTSPNPLLKDTTKGLEVKKRGEIATDETGKTSIDGVFCGGDAATGAATVIKAMGAGKLAAKSIDEYLSK